MSPEEVRRIVNEEIDRRDAAWKRLLEEREKRWTDIYDSLLREISQNDDAVKALVAREAKRLEFRINAVGAIAILGVVGNIGGIVVTHILGG